jgi:hypothetical protein
MTTKSTFMGLSARWDIHPDHIRFKRQSTLIGEWERTPPLKAWGQDALAGVFRAVFMVVIVMVLT